MENSTTMADYGDLPPLPEYHLTPVPALLPPLSDKFLTLLLPVVAYWAFSMLFHLIDTMDLFPQYRLHTPVEVLKRNRASRWEVIRDVVLQQVIQTIVGIILNSFEPDDYTGKEQYDIAIWARRIRLAQRAIPGILSMIGIDPYGLGRALGPKYPVLAGAVLGGQYHLVPGLSAQMVDVKGATVAFARWETALAWLLYYVGIPSFQFLVGICVVDTWQYFLHRGMHMNKWLYTTFHSRHHRLYVPYAYGALYNHPFEGFLLDTLGTAIAFKIAGMSTRQGLCFFTGSTIKTVDDHCGYALPFDPLQHLTSNNAGYHDVHHQSWGIKSNFSQPFFTFWDRLLGTVWTGGDVSARYERSRMAAQKALDQDNAKPVTGSMSSDSLRSPPEPYENEIQDAKVSTHLSLLKRKPHTPAGKAEFQAAGSRQQILEDPDAGAGVLEDEAREEIHAQQSTRLSPRKRALSTKDSFKGLRDRIPSNALCQSGMIGVNGNR